MYTFLQMNILNLRENIAEALLFKAPSQRCKRQRQHVQETSYAVVLMIWIVMVIIDDEYGRDDIYRDGR